MKTESFSACDEIAALYKKFNVPSSKTIGMFGGKAYTWFISKKDQPYQVSCECSILTAGYGRLIVESKISGLASKAHWFKGSPSIIYYKMHREQSLPNKATFFIKGIGVQQDHELNLPIPDNIDINKTYI